MRKKRVLTPEEQVILSQLADRNGVTLRIYYRLVEPMEQHYFEKPKKYHPPPRDNYTLSVIGGTGHSDKSSELPTLRILQQNKQIISPSQVKRSV